MSEVFIVVVVVVPGGRILHQLPPHPSEGPLIVCAKVPHNFKKSIPLQDLDKLVLFGMGCHV